jgi:hypothetical protein
MAEGQSYELLFPIETTRKVKGGEEETDVVSVVEIRKAKAGDLLVMDRHKGQIAQALALIEQLSDLNMAQVRKLDVEDMQALTEIVTSFLPGSQTDGTTS